MAGTTTAICDSFKSEVMQAKHDFTASTGSAFKLALVKVTPTGTYDRTTTNYSNLTGNSDEVAAGGGYSTGGVALTNTTPVVNGGQGCASFSNPSWTSATFSTTGAIDYNTSQSNKAVAIFDFGGTQSVSAGTLTLVVPAQTAGNAIIRIT